MITVKESDFDATEALLKDEGVQKVYDGSNHSSSTGRKSQFQLSSLTGF